MKLSILNQLWKKKYPTGNIYSYHTGGKLLNSGNTGKWAVKYNDTGKSYIFRESTVYKLAERLKLIPDHDYDYWVESEKAINALLSGNTFNSICGLYDTIRAINSDIEFYTTEFKDIYDRTVYTYCIK